MTKKFFTNREGNTLMSRFEGVLNNNPMIKNLDAVVGFLRASGYFKLRPFLDNINKARILIGIDVDKYIVEAVNANRIFFGEPEKVKNDCLENMRHDIERSHYSKEVEDGITQMALDLANGKLELRAHPSKKIHAKIYILYPDVFNEHTLGATAITGSSNLSGNGLGISSERQYEFNVELNDYDDVKFAKDEFELLWEEAKDCPITVDDVRTTIKQTYLGSDVTPYELYIKMLIEFFDDRITQLDVNNPFDMPTGYQRMEYQTDAVEEGYQKLIKYDGFFLADVVGLGKTVVAAMITKKFIMENGRDNTRVLVVYPPAVEQNWMQTFKDFQIDGMTTFISNGSLSKILDSDNYKYGNPEDFDLVLVDEAHKFRNHTSGMFAELQEICKMPRINEGNIPGSRKKVMLISATPMNNSPADIYYELQLFQDPNRCTIEGVTSLSNFFSPLIVEFKKLRRDEDYDAVAYKKLAEKVRDNIIKPITVRRTRTDIEGIERYNKDINGFPHVEKPVQVSYELNDKLADMFEEAMDILTNQLTYSRYKAIAGLKDEVAKGTYEQAERISMNLAGISKNGLVKRLESSFFAFKRSLANFQKANKNMIDMFDNDTVYIAPDLDINKMMETMTEEEIYDKIMEKAEDNPKNAIFKAEDFEDGFYESLLHDQQLVDKMVKQWDNIGNVDDTKFNEFVKLMKHKLFATDRNPGGKLVVFSESVDTVHYLYDRITKELGRKDVIYVSSENRKDKFNSIRENFDANIDNGKQKNDYNIIITSDVLAEGVNLHRSNIIVNYDTPWNSTKLMQRIGRVNRIGSVSKHIYNYVFYPSRQGDNQINLNKIALSKIQTFHTTFGEDNKIYSSDEIVDRDLDKLFDEGIKSQEQERNEELPFVEELRDLAVNNRKEYKRIKNLSIRSRTGRETRTIDGVTLSDDTLVFLKTNMRKCFYIANDSDAENVAIVDALKYFKAEKDEQGVERIASHHDHVIKALDKFVADIHQEHILEDTSAGVKTNLGAQQATANTLVVQIMQSIDDDDVKVQLSHLKSLLNDGVLTNIAKRLQRIHKELMNRKMKMDEAVAEIVAMAQKFDRYYTLSDIRNKVPESSADIILSESFR